MPGRDMTGPTGQGAMTGRGLGLCNPNQVGYNNRRQPLGLGLGFRRGAGRGLGRGLARGRGYGLGYGATELTLQQEKDILQTRLNEINKELKD